MAYKVIILYRLYMPSYVLGTFTEYPWINREKLDAESSFKAYLFTIAYHLLLKELRRQLNNTSMEEFIEYNDNIRTSGDEAEKQIDFDQFCKALKQAKEKLTPRQREIFELNKEQNLREFGIRYSL